MRIKKKVKKVFKLIVFLILILFAFFIFKVQIKELVSDIDNKIKPETYEYQNEITGEVSSSIKKLVIDYLNVYFRSMKELKEYDLTSFYASNAYEEAYLGQTALRVLIDSRIKQLNDLTLDKASYDLKFIDVSTSNDEITIKFLEHSYLNFEFMKNIRSNLYNVSNTMVLVKENDNYKIKSFDKEQGYFIMVKNLYSFKNNNNDEIKSELDKIKDEYSLIFSESLFRQQELYTNYSNTPVLEFKTCDHEYDRDKALLYASKYVTERANTDYGEYGGNCQNFGSWVLNAGGIPMDTKGSYQWKHYGTTLNYNHAKEGRTASWTGVLSFYEYAKNNVGYGLCSKVDVNTYYAEPGDIIQIGYDGYFRHTTVVVGSVKENNLVKDILLNSNTGDLEQFPLSAYLYPEKRLIKILGWND